MSVLDRLLLRFRSSGMAREENTVVIIESLEPVTHLYSGARESSTSPSTRCSKPNGLLYEATRRIGKSPVEVQCSCQLP